jgi:hypothetical protein
MGSFNTTCFVTNQTIASEDRVRLFPIAQQTSYNPVKLSYKDKEWEQFSYCSSTCYPTRFWEFCGPCLTGEYDDYGQFILDNTPKNQDSIRRVFNYLLGNAAITKKGKNECHDIAFDMSKIYSKDKKYTFKQLINIWEKMWTAVVHECRVFVRDYQGAFRPFGFSVMHESTAKYLIDFSENSKDWNGLVETRYDFIKNTYNEHHVIDLVKEYLSDKEANFMSMFRIEGIVRDYLRCGEGMDVARHYNIDYDAVIVKIANGMLAGMASEITDGIVKDIMPLFDSLFDAHYIMGGLNELNISISPIVYASQDYSNDVGKQYTELVTKVCQEVSAFRKQKYGDDE